MCPYCEKPARLTSGAELYPHWEDLQYVQVWQCKPCGARVGCHNNTTVPKGTLANAELRKLRIEAHNAFDPIWRKGNKNRSEAYTWLAKKMGITTSKCHIGSFNLEMCKQVLKVCGA